jgi:hypothetical protein
MMDQLILFHKPNKKVRSEKMDHSIPQTKHTSNGWVGLAGQIGMWLAYILTDTYICFIYHARLIFFGIARQDLPQST